MGGQLKLLNSVARIPGASASAVSWLFEMAGQVGADTPYMLKQIAGEQAIAAAAEAAQQADAAQQQQQHAGAERRNTDAAVEAAKARYLARKAQKRGK